MQSFQAALELGVEGFQWEPTLAVVNGRYGLQQDGIESGGPCQALERPGLDTVVAVEGFVLGLGAVALLVHQWFFTWPPAPSLTPTRLVAQEDQRSCKRFIVISRTLRSFATGSSPSAYFPESAEFYGSATFLDAPIQNAVRGRG